MEDHVMNLILVGVLSWTSLFLLIRKYLAARSFDFCNRLVSTIHAILAVILASLSVQDWRRPSYPVATKPSPRQTQALAVSLSYLIYDLVCCLFDNHFKFDNVIHHLVSIIGIGGGLVYEKSGSELVAALWITEISSPFLHLRELLKELGYKDTDLNLAADPKHGARKLMFAYAIIDAFGDGLTILFAVIFTFGRMIYGPYQAYVTLTASNPPLIQAMAVGLQLVSAFWFYKIARMVKHKLSKRTKSAKVT